jgi:hypothetical protein
MFSSYLRKVGWLVVNARHAILEALGGGILPAA